MDKETVCQLLQKHVDANPMKSSETFWEAERALDAQVPGVPASLISAYFEKVQSVWPEVAPNLANRDAVTLGAWAVAAARLPENLWSGVLLDYWRGDPERLARAYQELKHLYEAPAEPSLPDLPSQDRELVAAVRNQLGRHPRFSVSAGWSALLVQEGSGESIAAVRQHVIEPIEDEMTDWEMDDLLRLVPSPSTGVAAEFLAELRGRVEQRNRRNGQDEFFQALGWETVPQTFALVANLPAKSGHRFSLSLSRQWRRSLVSWNAFLGKQQASYLINENGVLTNKLKLGAYGLTQLQELLEIAAKHWKTRWVGPWEIVCEEGLPGPVGPLLSKYFEATA